MTVTPSWATDAAEVREVDRFLGRYLEPDARPEIGKLLRRVEQGLADVRVFRHAGADPVAGYVLYRLAADCVARILAESLLTGREFTDGDLAREPAGWYVAAIVAVAGHARTALTDLTVQTGATTPAPLFARGATDAGRRLMVGNGFEPLPPPSQIWWRPTATDVGQPPSA